MSAPPAAGVGGPPAALECGTICAVAGASQREMREWAAAYPRLYGSKAFDPALFSTLALASAFSGPGHTAADLRMANRACLWCFGLDWLIDYAATSAQEVRDIVRRCEAVADGGAPTRDDELTQFLAEIRDELSTASAFAQLRPIWRDELRRMLEAMALEWSWKAARDAGEIDRPTFAEYLDNADNLGFSFVFASHWICTVEGAVDGTSIDPVRAASWAVQRVIRLLNDLGTYERDLAWGDLNGLMFDVDRAGVEQHLAEVTTQARQRIREVRVAHPHFAQYAAYMERQMDFCAGFYGIADYWGTL